MGKGRPKKKRNYSRVTDFKKGEIVTLAKSYEKEEKEVNYSEIARNVGCSDKTVKAILVKYKNGQSLDPKPRSGRPRITTSADDRAIKYQSVKNRRLTAVDIRRNVLTKDGKHPCVRTIRNRLIEVGLNGRVAAKKPFLKPEHIAARLEWAKKYREWDVDNWRSVVFSDESPFTLFRRAGKQWVRRRIGERYNPECILPTVKMGGGKIQVWGCFSYYNVGPIKRVEGIMNGPMYRSILKTYMAPYLRQLKKDKDVEFIFQHDNDPKHTSKVAKNYLHNANIVILDWPSQSPDLNPIEHLWNIVKIKLDNLQQRPSSLENLFDIAKEEWENLGLETLQTLINSMPDRIEAVIRAKGHSTKY
jgi:transposase